MNKTYRSIWNETLGTFVAAPEITSANGKKARKTVVAAAAAVVMAGGVGSVGAQTATGTTTSGGTAVPSGAGYGVCYFDTGLKSVVCGDSTTQVQSATPTVSVTNTVAIGWGSKVTSSNGIAIGSSASASGHSALALGSGANASGVSATALGYGANASEYMATALGSGANASGVSATALGYTASASGVDAMALGTGAKASEYMATALGAYSEASGHSALALGSGAKASEYMATALGAYSEASGYMATALGYGANASEYMATALGYTASASGVDAMALGSGANASEYTATALGAHSKASGHSALALGSGANASGSMATALGYTASASASSSIALGNDSHTDAYASIAIGENSYATSDNNYSWGEPSVAIGRNSQATDAVAIGSSAVADRFAVAMGGGALAGAQSVAIGANSRANGQFSTVVGGDVRLNGSDSVASGAGLLSFGDGTVAMGGSGRIGSLSMNSGAGVKEYPGLNTILAGYHAEEMPPPLNNGETPIVYAQPMVSGNYSSMIGGGNFVVGDDTHVMGNENGLAVSRFYADGNSPFYGAAFRADDSGVLGNRNKAGYGGVATDAGIVGNDNFISAAKGVSILGSSNRIGALPTRKSDSFEVDDYEGIIGGGVDEVVDQVDGSHIVGNDNVVLSSNTLVLGNNVTNTIANSVVLGNSSASQASGAHTAGTTAVTGATIRGTNYTYAGSAVPGNVISVGDVGREGRIQNVAAGRVSATSTDAINGSQLFAVQSAVNTLESGATRYYSVNDGGVKGDNFNNDGATDVGSLAAGVGATASGPSATALGDRANASGASSISVGAHAGKSATGDYSTFIGESTGHYAAGAGNIAIGQQAGMGELDALTGKVVNNVEGNYNTAMGLWAGRGVTGDSNIAVGNVSGQNVAGVSNAAFGDFAGGQVTGSSNTAAGHLAGQNITGDRNVSWGYMAGSSLDAPTVVNDTVAVGSGSLVRTSNAVAVGRNALVEAQATDSVAIGVESLANRANTVSVGRSGSERQITNVAAGQMDTDAVNVSQLALANRYLAATSPQSQADAAVASGANSVSLGGYSVASGSSAVAVGEGSQALGDKSLAIGYGNIVTGTGSGAIGDPSIINADSSYSIGNDNLIAENQTDVFVLGNQVSIGAGTTGAIAIGSGSRVTTPGSVALGRGSVADRASSVSVGVAGAERQIINVAAGTVDTDAVNLGQLKAIGDVAQAASGGWVAAVRGSNYGNIRPGDSLNFSNASDNLRVYADNSGEMPTIAFDLNNILRVDHVNAGGTQMDQEGVRLANNGPMLTQQGLYNAGQRIMGVADGVDGMDAVNVRQLATEAGRLQARSDEADYRIVSALGAGAQYDPETRNWTAPTYTVGDGSYNNVGDAIAALELTGQQALNRDTRFFKANGDAASVDAQAQGVHTVSIGGDAIAQADNSVALGFGSTAERINTVSVGASGAERQITNVAAGTVETDAVNLGQLHQVEAAARQRTDVAASGAAAALGGGAFHDVDTGVWTAPQYEVAGGSYDNVGDALTAVEQAGAAQVDSRTRYFRANSTAEGSLAEGLESVAIGGNAIAAASGSVALGFGSTADRANTVSVGASGAERQITNVAAGTMDTDAVNLGQLNTVQASAVQAQARADEAVARSDNLGASTAAALGGGAAYDAATGGWTAPAYRIADGTYNNVGDALVAVNGSLTTVHNDMATVRGDVSSLQQTVANAGFGLVQQDQDSRVLHVGKNTDGTTVDLTGTAGARVLTGVAAGAVAEGSLDAVNGGQLHAAQEAARSYTDTMVTGGTAQASFKSVNVNGGKVTNVAAGEVSEKSQDAINGGQLYSAVKYYQANSTAARADAKGAKSVAIGGGSAAKADNSVALGEGSVADRANTVSVGASGAERQITNVAAGEKLTDAVNVGQMGALFGNVQGRIDSMAGQIGANRKIASGGIAQAMAFEQPLDTRPGKFSMGAGFGNFDGQSAVALTGSYLNERGNVRYSAGVSGGTSSKVGVRAGISFVFE